MYQIYKTDLSGKEELIACTLTENYAHEIVQSFRTKYQNQLYFYKEVIEYDNLAGYLWAGRWLEIESETDENEYRFSLAYYEKKGRFEAYVQVYHKSEDNNCENEEEHTVENIHFDRDLKTLILELMKTYGSQFTKPFVEIMEKKFKL